MAVYRHFQDREDLQGALIARGYEALMRHLQPALIGPTPRERLSMMVGGYVDFALSAPGTYALMFSHRMDGEDQRKLANRRNAASFLMLQDRVRECVSAGVFPADADPESVALDVWGMLHGLVTLHYAGKIGFSEERLRTHIEKMIDRLFPDSAT